MVGSPQRGRHLVVAFAAPAAWPAAAAGPSAGAPPLLPQSLPAAVPAARGGVTSSWARRHCRVPMAAHPARSRLLLPVGAHPRRPWAAAGGGGRSSLPGAPRMAASAEASPAEDGPPPSGGDTVAAAADAASEEALTLRRKLSASLKLQIRIAMGFLLGGAAITWIFCGTAAFAALMLLVTLLGQLEYYRMAIRKGHTPAQRMGLATTVATMVSSLFSPSLADAVFPVGGTLILVYLLFRKRKIATIADISTTFMGLFYAGYLPSFWVRLHGWEPVGGSHAARALAAAITTVWPAAVLPFRPLLTTGALVVFWTWLANASADIGAFFVGRTFGKTPISSLSPKKTAEGAVAGFLCSASVSLLGAYLLRWPMWQVTGAIYGVGVGVVGLLGDLTASMFKRDAGVKDSGRLFPGHGGILDRTDSYVLSAPLVYYFVTAVLPLLM